MLVLWLGAHCPHFHPHCCWGTPFWIDPFFPHLTFFQWWTSKVNISMSIWQLIKNTLTSVGLIGGNSGCTATGTGKGALGAAWAALGAAVVDVVGSSTGFLATSCFFFSTASSSIFGFLAAKKSKTEKFGFFLVMLWASLYFLELN